MELVFWIFVCVWCAMGAGMAWVAGKNERYGYLVTVIVMIITSYLIYLLNSRCP